MLMMPINDDKLRHIHDPGTSEAPQLKLHEQTPVQTKREEGS